MGDFSSHVHIQNIVSQDSASFNQKVDINESQYSRQIEVYFKPYSHFDREKYILFIIPPPNPSLVDTRQLHIVSLSYSMLKQKHKAEYVNTRILTYKYDSNIPNNPKLHLVCLLQEGIHLQHQISTVLLRVSTTNSFSCLLFRSLLIHHINI